MMKRAPQILIALLGTVLTMALLVGCSTTPEAQKNAYKKTIDEIQLKANKLPPAMKMDIEKKVTEFNSEFESAGDDIDKLVALNRRVTKYLGDIKKETGEVPAAAGTRTGTKPVGSKIGATAKPGTMGGTAAPGGKIGGTAPMGTTPTGMAPGVAAPGGKLGGTAPVGTTPTGTAVPGGKLGGTAPAGTAPTGTAPAGGFGGK